MNSKKRSGEFIANARGQLIGRYGQAILVIVLVSFLNFLISSFANFTSVETLSLFLFRFLILIIINLLLGVLSFGMDRFFLNFARGVQGLSPADLFQGIKQNADKAIGIQIVYTIVFIIVEIPLSYFLYFTELDLLDSTIILLLFSFLSSLLHYVTKLFFGLNFYILVDKPDYSVLQILSESNRLMKGNRLRFVGIALRIFPLMLLGSLAFGFGLVWPMALYDTAIANFYLDLIGEEPYDPLSDKEPEKEPDPKSQLLM